MCSLCSFSLRTTVDSHTGYKCKNCNNKNTDAKLSKVTGTHLKDTAVCCLVQNNNAAQTIDAPVCTVAAVS